MSIWSIGRIISGTKLHRNLVTHEGESPHPYSAPILPGDTINWKPTIYSIILRNFYSPFPIQINIISRRFTSFRCTRFRSLPTWMNSIVKYTLIFLKVRIPDSYHKQRSALKSCFQNNYSLKKDLKKLVCVSTFQYHKRIAYKIIFLKL